MSDLDLDGFFDDANAQKVLDGEFKEETEFAGLFVGVMFIPMLLLQVFIIGLMIKDGLVIPWLIWEVVTFAFNFLIKRVIPGNSYQKMSRRLTKNVIIDSIMMVYIFVVQGFSMLIVLMILSFIVAPFFLIGTSVIAHEKKIKKSLTLANTSSLP